MSRLALLLSPLSSHGGRRVDAGLTSKARKLLEANGITHIMTLVTATDAEIDEIFEGHPVTRQGLEAFLVAIGEKTGTLLDEPTRAELKEVLRTQEGSPGWPSLAMAVHLAVRATKEEWSALAHRFERMGEDVLAINAFSLADAEAGVLLAIADRRFAMDSDPDRYVPYFKAAYPRGIPQDVAARLGLEPA